MENFVKQDCGRAEYYTIEGYENLDKSKIIDSTDIDRNLIDGYQKFDLTEFSFSLDEKEYDKLEYYGVDMDLFTDGTRPELEVEWNSKEITYAMAQKSVELIEGYANKYFLILDKKPLKLKLISFFSPSEYNYLTDSYEVLVEETPFNSTDETLHYIEKIIMNNYEDYTLDMIYFIEDYMSDHIEHYIDKNGNSYTFDNLIENHKKIVE